MTDTFLDCPTHGIQTTRSFMHIENSDVKVIGSSAQCPICGKLSPVIDGTYSELAGHVRVTLHPTPQQAQRLQAVLEWAQRQPEEAAERTARKVERQARKDAPGVMRILDWAVANNTIAAVTWVSLLVTLLGLYLSSNSLTAEDVSRIVEEQLQQHEISVQNEQEKPAEEQPTREGSRPGSESTDSHQRE